MKMKDNKTLIQLKPAKLANEFQITLQGLNDAKHIGMYTMYSLTSFGSEEDINEFIEALEYVRDIVYKGKGTLSS